MRRVRRQAELTKEMLASGSWKEATFKDYNFKTLGAPCEGGNLHPLLKVGLLCSFSTGFRRVKHEARREELIGGDVARDKHTGGWGGVFLCQLVMGDAVTVVFFVVVVKVVVVLLVGGSSGVGGVVGADISV